MNDKLLFANDRFYSLINLGDAEGVQSQFAREVPLQAVHPGRAPMTEREQVLSSFRELCLSPPQIECLNPVAMQYGALGVVTCLEKIGNGYLSASNIFVKQGEDWRMIAHHAGPLFDQDYIGQIKKDTQSVVIH